jgi:cation diffusion facilitator family transporter
MTADGFHSLSDGASNFIGLVGIHFCAKPKDAEHPYGHKKFETLFALGIAAMLIFVAFNLAKEGFARLLHPVIPEVNINSFVVMIITLIVNVFVMKYEFRRGKELQSDLLTVDSMHTKSDILTSLSVIVALIASKLGFPVLDPLITFLIAGFIVYSAFIIIKQESGILVDAAALHDTLIIEEFVKSIPGVAGCHKIRTRGRMDDVFIDLHVQVNGQMSMKDAHHLSHLIQELIMKKFPQIVDVIVHMEPQ